MSCRFSTWFYFRRVSESREGDCGTWEASLHRHRYVVVLSHRPGRYRVYSSCDPDSRDGSYIGNLDGAGLDRLRAKLDNTHPDGPVDPLFKRNPASGQRVAATLGAVDRKYVQESDLEKVAAAWKVAVEGEE